MSWSARMEPWWHTIRTRTRGDCRGRPFVGATRPAGSSACMPRRRTGRPSCRGIAARRTDVVRHRIRQLVDGNIHRPFEADHQDGPRNRHLGIDVVVELEHKAGKTVRRRKTRLAPDGLRAACIGERHGEKQQRGAKRRNTAAPKPARTGARLRPISSGSRPRHSRPSLDSNR